MILALFAKTACFLHESKVTGPEDNMITQSQTLALRDAFTSARASGNSTKLKESTMEVFCSRAMTFNNTATDQSVHVLARAWTVVPEWVMAGVNPRALRARPLLLPQQAL